MDLLVEFIKKGVKKNVEPNEGISVVLLLRRTLVLQMFEQQSYSINASVS